MARYRKPTLAILISLLAAGAGCATMPCCSVCALPGGAMQVAQTDSGTSGQQTRTPAFSQRERVKEGGEGVTVRGQSPAYPWEQGSYPSGQMPGGYPRAPQPVSGGAPMTANPTYNPYGTAGAPAAPYGAPPYGGTQYGAPQYAQQPSYGYQPPGNTLPPPPLPAVPAEAMPGVSPFTPGYPGFQPPTNLPPDIAATPTPLDVYVEETRTGQFMFGVAVNSNNGVTGQITITERNFDYLRFPTSWDDLLSGTAWRGAGQGLRIEAQPGNQMQRYLVSFTEPYFLDTNVSFNASAFYMDRGYFDWTESRYGGRLGWGYRLTPDLSVSASLRAEDVNVFNPRVPGVPDLDRVLGHNEVYSGRWTLTRDTRDLPFMPTQGHLIELAYEQVFGTFDYPRADISYSQYFMVRERPDGTGRHTVAFSSKVGFSGSDTPIFENYFAGGFSTLRGFAFRGASPIDTGVRVGGQFQMLNSVEYFFPLTADEMIRGTVFCDYGTVERDIALHTENFRIAPGVGLRINVPALGPAPLAFDFAFPLASADGDDKQSFSFFFGAMR